MRAEMKKYQSANCNNYYIKQNKPFFCCFIFSSSWTQLFFLTATQCHLNDEMNFSLIYMIVKTLSLIKCIQPVLSIHISSNIFKFNFLKKKLECGKSRKLVLFMSKKCFQFKKFVNLLKVSQSASAVFLLRSNPVSKIYYCAYIIYFLTSLL